MTDISDKTVTLIAGEREYTVRTQGGRLSARQIGHMFQVTNHIPLNCIIDFVLFEHADTTSGDMA